MNGVYGTKVDIRGLLEDLKQPLVYSLILNLTLLILVPYFTFIRPRTSKKIYSVDLFRMQPPPKKKEEIKKEKKSPPKLPDDTVNLNKDAKPPPPEDYAYELEDLDDVPRIMSMQKPKYPERLRLAGVEDRVIIKFMINYYGYVGKVEIIEPSEHMLFNDSSVAAVKKWQFTPPKINGKPASVWFIVPVKFELE